MADADKNILITPNVGQTTEPTIVFTGADNNPVTLRVLDDGTLSVEGSSGQLFSITDSLTGTIFAVNDISGVPSIEVIDDGTIRLAEVTGNVGIGVAAPSTKLDVSGTITATALDTASILNSTTNSNITIDPTGTGQVRILTTSALLLPVGNGSTDRPTGEEGLFRYNTSTQKVEWYNGTSWVSPDTAGGEANQNAFSTVTGDSGTADADTSTDSIAITGGAGTGILTTAATTPDSLTITLASSALTATASAGADELIFFDATDSSNPKKSTVTNFISDNSIMTSFTIVDDSSSTTTINQSDTLTIAGGTNITTVLTGTASAPIITINATDTNDNTTYDFATATSGTGNSVDLDLTGSDATTDTVTVTGGSNITITRNSATQFTISGTDTNTNTTYSISSETDASGAALRLTGSDISTSDVIFAEGTDIDVVRTDAATITINNTSTLDSVTGRGATTTNSITVGEISIDNININGNTISSTNSNGDIILDPNGTGNVAIDGNMTVAADNSISLSTNNYLSTDAVIKLYNLLDNSKPWITWYDNSNAAIAGIVAHEESISSTLHKHWSIETADSLGALQTRFQVDYGADQVDITVNDSNFIIGAGNPLTVGSAAGADSDVSLYNGAFYKYGTGSVGFGDKDWAVSGLTSPAKFEFYRATSTSTLMIHQDDGLASAELHLRSGTRDWVLENNATDLLITAEGSTIATYKTTGVDFIGTVAIDNLSIAGNTISSTNTNGDIILDPNGTGNVGIGTATPATDLHIESPGPTIRFTDSDGTNQFADVFYQGSTLTLRSRNGAQGGNITFEYDDGVTVTESVKITGSGRVGIGTSSPDRELHIADGTPVIRLQDTDGTDQYGDLFHSGSSLTFSARNNTSPGNIVFERFDGSVTTESMKINGVGDVGIGTSSPDERLHIVDSVAKVIAESTNTAQFTGSSFILENGATANKRGVSFGSFIRDADSSDSYFAIDGLDNTNAYEKTIFRYDLTDDFLSLKTADTDRLVINSSGNVGIGTSSPAERLHVVDSVAKVIAESTNTAQFTGSLFILENGATANKRGVSFGSFIRDADSSDSYFAIDGLDNTNAYEKTLLYYDLTSDTFILKTANTDRLTISSTGQLTAGTGYTPSAALDLATKGYVDTQLSSTGVALVSLTATNTTNSTHFITFTEAATGDEEVRTDTSLTYNPSTNVLTINDYSLPGSDGSAGQVLQTDGAGSVSFASLPSVEFEKETGDGSTTTFTITFLNGQTGTFTNNTIVSINGIVQEPTTAYSITNDQLTFTSAPESGDVIDVRNLGTTLTINQANETVSAGISAAGSTQGTATGLGSDINEVTTATLDTADGVILPVPTVGQRVTVINASGTTIQVFPNSGAQIGANGTNTSVSLGNGALLQFFAISSTQWYASYGVYV